MLVYAEEHVQKESIGADAALKELGHDYAVPHPICRLGTRAVDTKGVAVRALHYGQELDIAAWPLLNWDVGVAPCGRDAHGRQAGGRCGRVTPLVRKWENWDICNRNGEEGFKRNVHIVQELQGAT